MRTFHLQRDEDVTGKSGTGRVAEGIEFSDGIVAMHWQGEWPSSVVFYDGGLDAVEHLHGHNGRTHIVWTDGSAVPAR